MQMATSWNAVQHKKRGSKMCRMTWWAKGRFRYIASAPSAEALSATLYGHLTWRPLSRAER
jgi:hypothetical protein